MVSSRAHYVCDCLVTASFIKLLLPHAIVIEQVSCQTSLGSQYNLMGGGGGGGRGSGFSV